MKLIIASLDNLPRKHALLRTETQCKTRQYTILPETRHPKDTIKTVSMAVGASRFMHMLQPILL